MTITLEPSGRAPGNETSGQLRHQQPATIAEPDTVAVVGLDTWDCRPPSLSSNPVWA